MAKGVHTECFAKHLLEEQPKLGMTDIEIAYTAGSPFGAGVETSAGSLACFFLACAKFGDTFVRKAQDELDRVVGINRLPSFDDMEDLPYVKAVVSEVLRVSVGCDMLHCTWLDVRSDRREFDPNYHSGAR